MLLDKARIQYVDAAGLVCKLVISQFRAASINIS